ncbi:hypothetical protein IG631_22672 [Alternaria alternata]|jgi:hypothetical protein|nr:hypothetical protein IG631_22672 [Alternaria alternata]
MTIFGILSCTWLPFVQHGFSATVLLAGGAVFSLENHLGSWSHKRQSALDKLFRNTLRHLQCKPVPDPPVVCCRGFSSLLFTCEV